MALQILIVDADSGAAAATSAFVQHLVPNASIVCEASPERAWSIAQRTPPDLLLIDPAPYTPAGTLLIQLCKESWPAMQAVVLASAPQSPARMRACHADAYLEKPASPARLLDALKRVLDDTTRVAADCHVVSP